jgi:ABC-type polysaccharide/polyol phosphate export permease
MRVDTGAIPYPIFTLGALAPWSLFAGSVSQGVTSIIQGQQMVTRFAFPRAVLPLSSIGLSLVDLAVSGAIFLLFIFFLGDGLPLTALWFPVLLVLELVLIVGLVLLGSSLNVFARDFRLAVPLVVQVWLLLTPVMYPLSSVPSGLRSWYMLNPMTGLVESFRRVLVYGHAPEVAMLLPAAVGALVVFVMGTWYFSATESRFADVI